MLVRFSLNVRGERLMKKLVLGVATAAALLTAAAPAMAQVGVQVGPFGFGVGPGPYSGNCGWNNYCGNGGYYDYYGGGPVIRGGGWHGHSAFRGGHSHRR
jgi:hypothetical protein